MTFYDEDLEYSASPSEDEMEVYTHNDGWFQNINQNIRDCLQKNKCNWYWKAFIYCCYFQRTKISELYNCSFNGCDWIYFSLIQRAKINWPRRLCMRHPRWRLQCVADQCYYNFWSRRACVRHTWWRTKRSWPLFSPTFFFFFLFLFLSSPPSTFHPLRGISRAWKFVSPNILA